MRCPSISPLFACAFVACADQKISSTADPYLSPQDADGDGYTADRDCDDGDPWVHPGAVEVCDPYSRDENCDGVANDADPGLDPTSASLWFPDNDADGWGDADHPGVYACVQPTGMVADQTDCNDTEVAVHPEAAEVCDGIDNDCDGSTSEAGAARFIATDGAISHVTEALTGTSSVPVDYTLSTDGTLQMCEGTWYVRLEVQANVAIHGTGADRVMLSSSAAGTVIDIAGSDRDVEIQGLTVTDGVADGMSPMLDTYAGGGINCYDASGSSSLTLDNVELHANDAIVGGGLSLFGCDATVTNSTIAHNAAWFGGGIYASWSGLTLDGVVVSENEAWTNGGGVLTDGTTGSTTLSLVQSSVRDNVADRGGGLYLSSVESSSCVGATDSTAGILSNRASVAGGGVYFAQGEVFASDTCDFGVLALGTDNHPEDVHISVDSVYADYGDDASFTCDRNTCE